MAHRFELEPSGTKLTGSAATPLGTLEIEHGKVDGDNVTFSIAYEYQGMTYVMDYAGKLKGDEIEFSIDVQGLATLTMTIKKSA